MSKRTYHEKPRPKQAQEETPQDDYTPAERERASKLREDLDAVLDEIDQVLEENAQEFVQNYVQRGGQ